MRINNLPKNERPRERLLLYGVDSLSNIDLLSIIIGNGSKGINVRELSESILYKYKSVNNLQDITINSLASIKGLGMVKAMKIICSIELGKRVLEKEVDTRMYLRSNDEVHEVFKKYFFNIKKEKFMIIMLDNCNRLIKYEILFTGTETRALISLKDIFKECILNSATKLIVIHNHPSGNLRASKEDIDLTSSLIYDSKLLDIIFLDHLITNGIDYTSIMLTEFKK